MVEKLIKLLKDYNPYFQNEKLATYLFNNNVIVLPCTVGDIVYRIGYSACYYGETDPNTDYCHGCEDDCDIEKIIIKEVVPDIKFIVNNIMCNNSNYFLNKNDAEEYLKNNK